MKKTLLTVLTVLFFAPMAFAGNWGAGIKAGIGENDPKTMKNTYDDSFANKEMTESGGIFGVEGLYEHRLNEKDTLGFKVGLDFYGENELEISTDFRDVWGRPLGGKGEATENTYAIPLTVYYKRDNGIKNWSFFAGVGITYIHSEVEGEVEDYMGRDLLSEKTSDSKVFPHLMAGTEYRFSELFALGLEAKYNFSAKTEKNYEGLNVVLSDRSGLSGAVTARFYF